MGRVMLEGINHWIRCLGWAVSVQVRELECPLGTVFTSSFVFFFVVQIQFNNFLRSP